MKKLTIKDFKTKKIGIATYRTFLGKKCEICIESGFKCVDIAVYDLKKDLLEPKITLNSPEYGKSDAKSFVDFLKEIDSTVNKFYKKWEIKK